MFVQDPAPTAQLSIGAFTLTKLKRCFSVFKAMVLDAGQAISNGSGGGDSGGDSGLARSHGPAPIGGGAHGGVGGQPGEGDAGQLGGQVRRCCVHHAEDVAGGSWVDSVWSTCFCVRCVAR